MKHRETFFWVLLFLIISSLNVFSQTLKIEQVKDGILKNGVAGGVISPFDKQLYFFNISRQDSQSSKIIVSKVSDRGIEIVSEVISPFYHFSDRYDFTIDSKGVYIFVNGKGEMVSETLIYDPSKKTGLFLHYYDIDKNTTDKFPNIRFEKYSKEKTPIFSGNKYEGGFVFPSFNYEKGYISSNPGVTITSNGIKDIPNYNLVNFENTKSFSSGLFYDNPNYVWGTNIVDYYSTYIVRHNIANNEQKKFLISDKEYISKIHLSSLVNKDYYIVVKDNAIYSIKNGILKERKNDFSLEFLSKGHFIDNKNTIWGFDYDSKSLLGIKEDLSIEKREIDFGEHQNAFSFAPILIFFYESSNDVIYVQANSLYKLSNKTVESLHSNFSYSQPETDKLSIVFQDQSTGSPTSWKWDFGDGTSSTQQNPTKTYSKEGNYKVTLTISKTGVSPSSMSKEIEILAQEAPKINRAIKITKPTDGSNLNASDPMYINLELTEGTILAGVKGEIKNLDGSLRKSLGTVNGGNLANSPFSLKDILPGEYYLKVSGVNQPNLVDSVRITVNNRSRSGGVTVVTHGFQMFGKDDLSDDWTIRNDKTKQIAFCEAIKKRIELEGGSASVYENDLKNPGKWKRISKEDSKVEDEVILFFNWSKLSDDGLFSKADGVLESSADYLFAMLANPLLSGKGNLPQNIFESDVPLHFIGHSRGTVLLLQLSHRIYKYFPNRKIEQLTLLDPHPAVPMNDLNNNQDFSLPGVYGSKDRFLTGGLSLKVLPNVSKCDSYYRQSSWYESLDLTWDLTDFSGIPVDGANNRMLSHEELEKGATPISLIGVGLLKVAHTAVTEWYIGTILPDDPAFATDSRANWYILNRDRFGYNQSRVGGRLSELNEQSVFASLTDYDKRLENRTGSNMNPVFNHSFKYQRYGWFNYGGESTTQPGGGVINYGFLPNEKYLISSKYKEIALMHNYLYFPKDYNYLKIELDDSSEDIYFTVLFANRNTNFLPINIRTRNGVSVYYAEIPEQLKGDVGNFTITMSVSDKNKYIIVNSTLLSFDKEGSENSIFSQHWRNGEQSQALKLKGVVADGVSKVLIKIGSEDLSTVLNVNRAAKIQIALKDNSGIINTSQYIGSIKSITNTDELTSPNLITHKGEISAINSQRFDNTFHFEYQAPTDFARNYEGIDDSYLAERSIRAEITLLDANNNELDRLHHTISIVRPPLILAHGLGGGGSEADESTWRNFRYTTEKGEVIFKNSNLFLVKRDINLYPTASFDANSDVLLGFDDTKKKESFNAILQQMNDLGYAAAKVDYIAHSMGGSVLRNTLEKPKYKNQTNYNQGYVNKFITICTPHQGSPLGDIVSEFSPYLYLDPANMLYHTLVLDFYLGYYNIKLREASPAIKNLSLKKENGGIHFPKQEVKNHVIVGNYVAQYLDKPVKAFSSLNYNSENEGFKLLNLLFAFAAVVKFNECNCKQELNEVWEIINQNIKIQNNVWSVGQLLENLFKRNIPGANVVIPDNNFTYYFMNWASKRINYSSIPFIENSDFIVSIESQFGGKYEQWKNDEKNSSEAPYSVFENITHNFAPYKATFDLGVGNRVFELLNKPINSLYFDTELAASPEITTPISCFDECKNEPTNSLIKLFPNPAVNRFEVDLSNANITENYEIELYDPKGSLIKTQSFGKDCCPVVQHNFISPGVYTVRVKSSTQIFSSKLVINP